MALGIQVGRADVDQHRLAPIAARERLGERHLGSARARALGPEHAGERHDGQPEEEAGANREAGHRLHRSIGPGGFVSRDGRTLPLLVVDGRQPGWSIGATLPELAALMLKAGAWNAINLDGGGSSAMWYREPGAPAGRILNRPSNDRLQPVANHLGVRVKQPQDGEPTPP